MSPKFETEIFYGLGNQFIFDQILTDLVIPLLLSEVDQGGEREDADGDEKEEEPQLLVGLHGDHNS